MNEAEQQQPGVEETYDFDQGTPSDFSENPWLERTLDRTAFYVGGKRGDKSAELQKDGEARCFIIRRPQAKNIYAGVGIRMQVARRDDGSVVGIPFYSSARLNEGWTYLAKKGKNAGKWMLGIQYGPTESCALARLVQARPDLIAPATFMGAVQYWPARDGEQAQAKQDYKKFYVVEAFEVLFEYQDVPNPAQPGLTKRVVVMDPTTQKPKYTINPKPYIWEMNEPWWQQYRNKILAPKFSQAVSSAADIDGVAPAPQKQLPTNDPSKVLLKLFARTNPEDPAKAKYEVDFSPSLVIDSSALQVVDPLPALPDGSIDWNQVYPPMTEEQAQGLVARADGGASTYGQPAVGGDDSFVGGGASTGQGVGQVTNPPAGVPAGEDDIPF